MKSQDYCADLQLTCKLIDMKRKGESLSIILSRVIRILDNIWHYMSLIINAILNMYVIALYICIINIFNKINLSCAQKFAFIKLS